MRSHYKRWNVRRAFELRERVSERERLFIESEYYLNASRELEKAARTNELWKETYPRDPTPHFILGTIYQGLGQHEKALRETRDYLRLEPSSGPGYAALGLNYLLLDRLDEARTALEQAGAHKVEAEFLMEARYVLAFLRGDAMEMEQLVAAAAGQPGFEYDLLALQADSEACHGRLTKARDLMRRAIDSATRDGNRDVAAALEAATALQEADFDNREQARRQALSALALARKLEVQTYAALALARADDATRARAMADDLNKRRPLDTMLNHYWLPAVRAAVEVCNRDPSQAVRLLQVSAPYELAAPRVPSAGLLLYPVYVRGEAYLALHQGSQAAVEFQKILDHPGIMMNSPLGALAHLGLGRAYALPFGVGAGLVPAQTGRPQEAPLQPDALAKARTAYQDFFALWKDADPDIPILKQAKVEYAKLK
jgi:tetratricopeptide (TPR) repeat protein